MKDSQGDCETQELGGKFCGRRWNGDTDRGSVFSSDLPWMCTMMAAKDDGQILSVRPCLAQAIMRWLTRGMITETRRATIARRILRTQRAARARMLAQSSSNVGCRSTVADTSDCWKDGFYEEWINVGHGEYNPFCFVEGDDNRAKTEADLSFGAYEEAVLIRSNEDMCRWTMCYKEIDNTFTEDDCWNLSPPANTHHHWSGNIGGDNGTCVIEGNDLGPAGCWYHNSHAFIS